MEAWNFQIRYTSGWKKIMIDKRISYRFGGGYQGSSAGPVDRGNTGGNGGNTNREKRGIQQSYSAPAPTQSRQESEAREEKARVDKAKADAREQAMTKITAPKTTTTSKYEVKNPFEETGQTKKEQAKIASDVQELRDKVKTFDQEFTPELYVSLDKYMKDKGLYSSGDVKEKTEPKIDEGLGLINPFEQPGARTAIPTTPVRTRIQNERAEDIRKKALGDIALQTDKSLIDVSDPSKQGIVGSLIDTGKNQLKKRATNFALNKLGLGFLNPVLGIASMLGYDPIGSFMAKFPKGTGTKTIDNIPKGDGREEGIMQAQTPQNIIEENIQKFSPEQLNLLRKRYAELQQVIESGEYNGQKLNNNQLATLTQTSKQMKDFLVSEVGGMRLT